MNILKFFRKEQPKQALSFQTHAATVTPYTAGGSGDRLKARLERLHLARDAAKDRDRVLLLQKEIDDIESYLSQFK